jgi:hypothetical protein
VLGDDFILPAQLAFVARALAQMDGVGKALDPDFEFIASAAEAIPSLKGRRAWLRDWAGKQRRRACDRANQMARDARKACERGVHTVVKLGRLVFHAGFRWEEEGTTVPGS